MRRDEERSSSAGRRELDSRKDERLDLEVGALPMRWVEKEEGALEGREEENMLKERMQRARSVAKVIRIWDIAYSSQDIIALGMCRA